MNWRYTEVSMMRLERGSDSVLVTVVTDERTGVSTIYTCWSFTDDVKIDSISLSHNEAIHFIKNELGVE